MDLAVLYTVTNDYGDIMIQTSNLSLAEFVEKHAKGIDRGLFLAVGGDSKRSIVKKGIFRRVHTK